MAEDPDLIRDLAEAIQPESRVGWYPEDSPEESALFAVSMTFSLLERLRKAAGR